MKKKITAQRRPNVIGRRLKRPWSVVHGSNWWLINMEPGPWWNIRFYDVRVYEKQTGGRQTLFLLLQLCFSLLPSSPDDSWRHVCGSAGSSYVNRRVLPPAACQTLLNLSLLGFSPAACKVLAKVLGGGGPQAEWGWRGKACLWPSVGVLRINHQPETIKTSVCLHFWGLYIWMWLMLVFRRVSSRFSCYRAVKPHQWSSPAGSQHPGFGMRSETNSKLLLMSNTRWGKIIMESEERRRWPLHGFKAN